MKIQKLLDLRKIIDPQNILSVASKLIAHNENRVGKTLKATLEEGDLVKLNCFKNGKDEAIGSQMK